MGREYSDRDIYPKGNYTRRKEAIGIAAVRIISCICGSEFAYTFVFVFALLLVGASVSACAFVIGSRLYP